MYWNVISKRGRPDLGQRVSKRYRREHHGKLMMERIGLCGPWSCGTSATVDRSHEARRFLTTTRMHTNNLARSADLHMNRRFHHTCDDLKPCLKVTKITRAHVRRPLQQAQSFPKWKGSLARTRWWDHGL
jgi:hypothetical protein